MSIFRSCSAQSHHARDKADSSAGFKSVRFCISMIARCKSRASERWLGGCLHPLRDGGMGFSWVLSGGVVTV